MLFAALVAAALFLPALPARAGDREVSYLHSLAGQYVGSGTVRTDRHRDTTRCALVMEPTGKKLSVSGFCAGAKIAGTIAYDDRSKRWLSTSGNRGVVGKRSGRSLTFTTSERNKNGNLRSTFTFAPGKVSLKFQLVFRNGTQSSGTISFRPS